MELLKVGGSMLPRCGLNLQPAMLKTTSFESADADRPMRSIIYWVAAVVATATLPAIAFSLLRRMITDSAPMMDRLAALALKETIFGLQMTALLGALWIALQGVSERNPSTAASRMSQGVKVCMIAGSVISVLLAARFALMLAFN